MKSLSHSTGPVACLLGAALFQAGSLVAEEVKTKTAEESKLPEVVVSGDAEKKPERPTKASGPKQPKDLIDTPQTINVIPEAQLKDQGVTTLRDALKDVAGISISAGEGGAQGDNLTLRGFSARSDIYMDGMRDFGSYFRDPFNLETVEVIKGPSSALFGRGSTGGIVNQVSKTPKKEANSGGTLSVGSDGTKRATADINQLINPTTAFRLNLLSHENQVAGRDIVESRRFGFAPSLIFGLGTSTRYTLSYLNQASNDIPDYGVPYLRGYVAPVDRSNYYGFKDHNFLKTQADVMTLKAEHDLGDTWVLRNQLRFAEFQRRGQITTARIPTTVTADTPVADISAERNQLTLDSQERAIDNDLSISGTFTTGGVKHSFLGGLEYIGEASTPKRFTYTGVPTTDLEHPDPQAVFAGTGTMSSRIKAKAVTMAAYVSDTLDFTDQWSFNAGLRWDSIKGEAEQFVGTPASFDSKDEAVSWRSGLAFKPTTKSNVYVSAGNSFNPSIEQLSLAANTEELDPEKNQSYELGYKQTFGTVNLETAVFRLEKTNARTPDATNPLLNVSTGKQRVDGAEIGVSGQVNSGWQISTGYTFLQSKILKSNRAGEQDASLSNTPKHTATLWSSHQVAPKWEVGGGLYAVSMRTAGSTPDAATGKIKEVPGYITYNAMAKYEVSAGFDVQLNILNLTDTQYYDAIHPSHIIPGAARSFLLTSQFTL